MQKVNCNNPLDWQYRFAEIISGDFLCLSGEAILLI